MRSTEATHTCETELERREIGYVPAVASDHQITTHAGKFRADALVKKLPKRTWQKLSAGARAKGTASTTGPWPTSPTTGRATTNASPHPPGDLSFGSRVPR